MESALRGIPCHKTFIAHYEHALADPQAFIEPLSLFLETDAAGREVRRPSLVFIAVNVSRLLRRD